jgi:hypothetical protein
MLIAPPVLVLLVRFTAVEHEHAEGRRALVFASYIQVEEPGPHSRREQPQAVSFLFVTNQ